MVMRLFRRLFALDPEEEQRDLSVPAPVACPDPFVAVGDIHGCYQLLDRIVTRARATCDGGTFVFVGDYIDRGEDSAAVLRRLMALSAEGAVCLLGNHEDMLLDYLDDPEGRGGLWLRNGGLQTLASFGVGGVSVATRGLELARARDELTVRMGEEMIGWLRTRPLWWRAGNVAVVHAGADPARPIDAQERRTLLWGHRDFNRKPRADGLWVIHGHTIVPEAAPEGGRIRIDTGAYATGRLSGVTIGPQGMRFFSA
jgi:serine/threonine protein phosphatase 1